MVAFEKSCDYAPATANGAAPLALYQVTLGTEPPVTLRDGQRTRVVLAGKTYEAVVGGLYGISFLLRAL